MKHDDNTLQDAIDAAMLEIKTGTQHKSLDTYVSNYWHKESPARLALAKAFLAKLPEPEPEPILADDGRSLGQVAKEAFIGAPGLTDDWMNAAAQAVSSVVLAQAIRRMEAVSHSEITNAYWQEGDGYENIRARLIAAAKGEEQDESDSTDWKAKYEQAEVERKKWEEDALRYCTNADYWQTERDKTLAEIGEYKVRVNQLHDTISNLKSSTIGILRPLSEAGPVPDGCVRVTALKGHKDDWAIGDSQSQHDTHFADIRLPRNETPARTVNEQSKQQVPLGPEDVPPGSIIRCDTDHWFQVLYASFTGICINNLGPPVEHKWRELAKNWQINTSIPDTGKWDASAWRPCSKPAKKGGRA